MSPLLFISHQVLATACRTAYKKFYRQAPEFEQVQRRKLAELLDQPLIDYPAFTQQYPITRYVDWKGKIEDSRHSGRNFLNQHKILRFQPTSGSSEALKFIPYTQAFLDELDQVIGLWLSNLYLRYPKLKHSSHYWSVSWLPESQRKLTQNQHLNDDSALLNFSKRILAQVTQSVPSEIALTATAEDAMFATAVYLAADVDLGMISVWSPTFALQLFSLIEQHQVEICDILKKGLWTRSSLQFLKAPQSKTQAKCLKQLDLKQANAWTVLWPKLSLISCWDTASASYWADQLRAKVANVAFEGKGLWATEGVVTIPLEGHYPLMYQAHFYEFFDIQTEQVYPSWELKIGQLVSPIITTGSGLIRYLIDDELRVENFYHGIPCFKFLGRKMTVDMVGEKIDQNTALDILARFKQDHYLPISLLGIEQDSTKKPYYLLLSEGDRDDAKPSQDQLDQVLKQNFHYELARNLGQLDQPEIMHVDDAWAHYKQLAMFNGMIEGNIKPEPLKKFKKMM